VEAYRVNIVGLSNNTHRFEYQIDDGFFRHYGGDLVSEGSFEVEVVLDKRETFLEMTMAISGTAKLVCDRSLEPFDHPVDVRKKVVFKYGDENQELTDEIVIIERNTVHLELGQYMYEFISLAVPMKKLHPRYRQEEDFGDGGIVYSSTSPTEKEDEETDPRWDKLKKLK
jgi:DUF177 domain-containing protein